MKTHILTSKTANYARINAIINSMGIGSKITCSGKAVSEDTGEVLAENATCIFTRISEDDYDWNHCCDYIENETISRCHLYHILLDAATDAKYNNDTTFSIKLER